MCHEALLIKTWLTLVINCTNLACSGLFGEIKDLTAKLFGANQRLCAGEIPTIFASLWSVQALLFDICFSECLLIKVSASSFGCTRHQRRLLRLICWLVLSQIVAIVIFQGLVWIDQIWTSSVRGSKLLKFGVFSNSYHLFRLC